MARVSLPDAAITYHIANSLGVMSNEKGKHEEAKVSISPPWGGGGGCLRRSTRRPSLRLFAWETSSMNYGLRRCARHYYQQALKVQERVLGKTHPSTLVIIMNMAIVFMDRLKDFTKAEDMFRLAVDGYKKSLGKDHVSTKRSARNLAIMLRDQGRQADL